MDTTINGKKYRIYELDNITTFTERLSNSMKTLPKYIYYNIENVNRREDINVFDLVDQNIEVIDILSIIRKHVDSGIFSNVYEEISELLGQTNLSLEKDILVPFIILNKDLLEADEKTAKIVLFSIEKEVNDDLELFTPKVRIVDNIWLEKDELIKEFTTELSKNKKKTEAITKLYSGFDAIDEGLYFTPFELERAVLELELNIENTSILEIFNNIQLNKNVPFATVRKFYKIYKEFIPPTDWNISTDNAIILKVLQKKADTNIKVTNYNTILIGSSKELGLNSDDSDKKQEEIELQPDSDKILASVYVDITSQNISKDEYISRFLDSLSGDLSVNKKITVIQEKEQKVNGVFYIPNQKMNKYIFSDMIMNNPIFSNFMSIDESDKASKRKNNIYVYFKHQLTGEVNVNITEKVFTRIETAVRKTRKELGKIGMELFPENSNYIRVKISKADNAEKAQLFQQIISKLFVVYNQEKDDIIKYYKNFIPDFGKEKAVKEIQESKSKLKDIAPEVFISGYPKKCPHAPRIISDEEAQEAMENGMTVMVYPKPGSDFESRNYICDHPEHKFPGLRDNPLENRDLVPFFPCCYSKDQSTVPGSKYRHYYFGEELQEKKDEQSRDLILTNKILHYNGTGILPKNLLKFLELVDDNEKYTFVRKGVYRNKNSFLECILDAINYKNIRSQKKKESIEKIVEDVRLSFAEQKYASACKQELYDRSISEIIETIKNMENYFDPRLFTGLLEKYFDCNIFVFSRKHTEAELILPRYLEGYYKFANKNKTIIILEHYGGESDHAQYPQCEIIAKVNTKKLSEITYNFEWESPISSSIRNIFSKISKTYVFGKEDYKIVKDFPIEIDEVFEQYIDSYGKIRYFEMEKEGVRFSIFTEPMAPFIINSIEKIEVKKVDYDDILNVAESINLEIVGQVVENIGSNIISKEIVGKIGNVSVNIPINDTNLISDLEIVVKSVVYLNNEESKLENYSKCKKTARYLTEYVFWLYSRFYNEKVNELKKKKKIVNLSYLSSLELINEFYIKYILIDENFVYGKISKNFSIKSNLIRDNKLVVNSLELAKRLIYVLHQYSIRHREKLLNYKNKYTIENYYIDVSDFEQYYYQVILEGDNSIEKWISEQKNKYKLYNKIVVDEIQPYFFMFDDKLQFREKGVYLAQNVSSLEGALNIAEKWNSEKYNIGSDEKEVEMENVDLESTDLESTDLELYTDMEKRPEFILYSYESSTEIKRYKVKGYKVDYEIKIIGYKTTTFQSSVENKVEKELNKFTVLLRF